MPINSTPTQVCSKIFRKASLCLLILSTVFSLDTAFCADYQFVKVQGPELVTDFDQDGKYEPYFIKGVAYEPIPVGRHVSDWGWPLNYQSDLNQINNIYDDPSILSRDFNYFNIMGANTIRIWAANDTSVPFEPGRYPNKITDRTLEYARDHDVKIIAGFFMPQAGDFRCAGNTTVYDTWFDYKNLDRQAELLNKFNQFIAEFKNRPEILFWAIGNENNLKLNPNDPEQIKAYYSLVNFMAANAKTIEGNYPGVTNYHPVAVIDGGIHFIGREDYGTRDVDLPNIDIWGSNVYWGSTFGTLFSDYQKKSTKPFYIAEYGTDAFRAFNPQQPSVGVEDQLQQAQWNGGLWDEIAANRGSRVIGGTVMAYSDEWWKPYEWNCEEAPQFCRGTISSTNVTFQWDARLLVDGTYTLKLGTQEGATNVYYNNAIAGTSVTVDTVPLGLRIYAQLSYRLPGRSLDTFEFFEYPASQGPSESSNLIKLRPPANKHNYFGFGPSDFSCPLDGTFDFIPDAPDQYLHEEWWGLMSIARNNYGADTLTPRQVFYTLKQKFASLPPYISSGSPNTMLPLGTTDSTLEISTDVNARCEFSTTPNTPYGQLTTLMYGNGGKHHTFPLTNLENGRFYDYYIRCQDLGSPSYVTNTVDYPVRFSVATTYEYWKTQKFTPAEQSNANISGELRDPDNDSIINLFEYAFGLEPKVNQTYLIEYRMLNGYFTYLYRKISASDLTYKILAKNQLTDPLWSEGAFAETLSSINGTNQVKLATARDTVLRTRGFFKMEITKGGQAALSIFAPPPSGSNTYYTLHINNAGGGKITSVSRNIDCGSACEWNGVQGSSETLTALPDSGYQFDGFSGACTGKGPCQVHFDQEKTVSASFSASASCGNQVIDAGETCDGENLNEQTCSSLGFKSGNLSCSACQLNTQSCTPFMCTGTIPSNSTLCPSDDTGLPQDAAFSTVFTCTDTQKCEVTCQGSRIPMNGQCSSCGNGVCEAGELESCSSCALDCGTCTNGLETICFRCRTLQVPAYLKSRYLSSGAREGACTSAICP